MIANNGLLNYSKFDVRNLEYDENGVLWSMKVDDM